MPGRRAKQNRKGVAERGDTPCRSNAGLLAALLIALVGMVGGLYVTLRGKSLEGMGTIGVTIVALVTVFALRKEPPSESD
jgi:hypothetical protein